MNKLTLTAAVTALGLMLTGCAMTTPEASAEADLIKYLRGETVSAAETVLDADSVGFWSTYSDEDLISFADKACTLVSDTVKAGEEAGDTTAETLGIGLVSIIANAAAESESSEVSLDSETPGALKEAISTLTMVKPAVTVYCTTHRDVTLAAIFFLESNAPEAEEGSAEAPALSEIEQLNVDLTSLVSRVADMDGNLQSGIAIIFGDDGRTVNLYSDQNGDNIVQESELLDTFVAPEGYLVTYEATGEYVMGEAYGTEAKLNVASLKVVNE
jgi:hypothetical protein